MKCVFAKRTKFIRGFCYYKLNKTCLFLHNSAEEKRTMLKQSAEERLKKENEIVASFRELISEKLSDSKEKK